MRTERLKRLATAAIELTVGAVLIWFLVVMVVPYAGEILAQRPRLRPPDWALLESQPPAILIHIGAAVIAFGLGVVQLVDVKGTTAHRILGWTWVVAMTVTTVSSLFIRGINDGGFSFIHILSGLTLIALPMAVHAARRHEVARHRKEMTGLFLGALVLAGLLAFLPGRLMWSVFFG